MLNRTLATGEPGPYALMAAISSLHNRRAVDGIIDWPTIAALYDRLLPLRPTVGVAVARAAAHREAHAIDMAADALAAIDKALVERHQPCWTVMAEVADRCEDTAIRTAARDRALLLTTDPAVRLHLETRWS